MEYHGYLYTMDGVKYVGVKWNPELDPFLVWFF